MVIILFLIVGILLLFLHCSLVLAKYADNELNLNINKNDYK